MTVREALNSAMAEEMQRDEKVILLGEVRQTRWPYGRPAPSRSLTIPPLPLGTLLLTI